MVSASLSEDEKGSTPGKSVRDVDSVGEHPNEGVGEDDSAPYSDYSSEVDHQEPELRSKSKKADQHLTAAFQGVMSSSGVDIQQEVDLAKRNPLRADRYLMNIMSKTVVREQVPPGTETESAPSSGVAPVAKKRPIMVAGVKAFAKSCPTAKSSSQ